MEKNSIQKEIMISLTNGVRKIGYPHQENNVILFSLKKEGNVAIWNKWMNLEDVMLRKINQTQKDKYSMISLTWN